MTRFKLSLEAGGMNTLGKNMQNRGRDLIQEGDNFLEQKRWKDTLTNAHDGRPQ